MGRKTKDTLIKEEVIRIKSMLADVPDKVLKANNSLIERAAFLAVTTKELERQMEIEGVVVKYDNGGGQRGDKISAASQTHNQMTKNLLARITPAGAGQTG